jgi:hypothetical protein
MADAGNEKCVEHAAGERIALAGDEGADAGIDAVADRFDRGGEPQPPARRRRRGHRRDRAQHQAGGADALEIEVAGEVVAAGMQRRGRRIDPRLHGDEGADRGRPALAHGEPDAFGPVAQARAFHRGDAEHDAVAALALLAGLDETGHGNAVGGRAQHGVLDDMGLDGGGGEARRDSGAAERDRKRGADAHEKGERDGGRIRRRHRFVFHRQPRHQPPGATSMAAHSRSLAASGPAISGNGTSHGAAAPAVPGRGHVPTRPCALPCPAMRGSAQGRA